MAFQIPISIKEAVENIDSKKYLLPSIQREVVWNVEKIERLFDSLMRDYPIGSFLFWQVKKENVDEYQFYEFVRNYHEKDNKHNIKAHVSGQNDIVGILDGQQRLTSLYIGLKGSYSYKEPRKRWNNSQAFPKRNLYLDLLRKKSNSEQIDSIFNFSFLTEDEAQQNLDSEYWFPLSNILSLAEEMDVNDYLIKHGIMDRLIDEKAFANRTLFKLWSIIHKSPIINYYLEKENSLDKVLNIFIRVNSAGIELSHSDLLLSIATAQWKERDAREEITSFVDEINGIGEGFNFDKDFVLKSSLVLSDFNDIAFKVSNFNKPNMLKIEEKWDQIKQALRGAVTLVSSFGYSRETLTSNNAIIPIAYFLKQLKLPNNFDIASKYVDDRKHIRHWLTIALLKRVFGGAPDTILRPIRELLSNNSGAFPIDSIIEKFKGTTKSVLFTDDDIDNLLYYKYGQGYTFSVLYFLYPTVDFRNRFHVDHIHPKSHFTKAKLLKHGIPESDIEYYLEHVNSLPNLQLLEGVPNQEKSDSDFLKWFEKTYHTSEQKSKYIEHHNFPECDFSLENFKEFIENRKELLRKRLAEVIGV